MTICSSLTEQLATNGIVVYKIVGKSMEPMLAPNRDIVTIKSLGDKDLHENDVILYNKCGKLKLHRIVEIAADGKLVTLGDNCAKKEYNIYRDDVCGILTSFIHNGVHYQTDDLVYLDYVQELRKTEKIRTKKKQIIDSAAWYLRFLPPSALSAAKSFIRKLIHCNPSF